MSSAKCPFCSALYPHNTVHSCPTAPEGHWTAYAVPPAVPVQREALDEDALTATERINALRESGALAAAHLRSPDDHTSQAIVDDLGLAFRVRSGSWSGSSVSLVREVGTYLAALALPEQGGAEAIKAHEQAILSAFSVPGPQFGPPPEHPVVTMLRRGIFGDPSTFTAREVALAALAAAPGARPEQRETLDEDDRADIEIVKACGLMRSAIHATGRRFALEDDLPATVGGGPVYRERARKALIAALGGA